MSDNQDPSSPVEDNSHLSEATRLRMQRVRELEQQRLQRVLARSITTAQQQPQPPAVAQQDVVADRRSPTLRSGSPTLRSRSPTLRSTGRSRFVSYASGRTNRSTSEDRNGTPASSAQDSSQPDDQVTGGRSEPSEKDKIEGSVFMKKLDELAANAESEELKLRYLRLKELEEMRLSGKAEGSCTTRGSTKLGRSASVNEHVSTGRLTRRNSDQVRDRVTRIGSPVMSRRTHDVDDFVAESSRLARASSATNLYAPDLSSLDRIFSDRRQESIRRIEELSKQRHQGIRSLSVDVESGDSLAVHPTLPQIEPASSVMFSRTHEPSIQYSSIDEGQEMPSPRYGSDSSLNRIGTGTAQDEFRRPSFESASGGTDNTMRHFYRDTKTPGMTYVDEEGHAKWITPTNPLFQQLRTTDTHSSLDRLTEERKKRSLLARDGLDDHFLMECFDPEISFEERIALIREKLYGSKVLIPSDKRRAMTDRGCPDGASQAMKDSPANGNAESDGEHR